MPRRIKRFGWKRDLPDHRDYKFREKLEHLLVPSIPDSVDFRPQMPPVVDQEQAGACTGNSTVALLEYNHLMTGGALLPLSRFFAYYNARVLEGTQDQDAGAELRDVISCLANQGICPETEWPYDLSQLTVQPPQQCYTDALQDEISVYAKLETLDDMLQCLAGGKPFVFGFTAFDSLESDEVARTGVLNLPTSDEQIIGGHAVVAVGYTQADKRFLIRNSWGTAWGQSGYFTMPYEYVANPNLASDFWVVTK